MVIQDEKKLALYREGYRPLACYCNGRKISGWKSFSQGLNFEYVTIPNAYTDRLQFTLHGKTQQTTAERYVTWRRQLVMDTSSVTGSSLSFEMGELANPDHRYILKIRFELDSPDKQLLVAKIGEDNYDMYNEVTYVGGIQEEIIEEYAYGDSDYLHLMCEDGTVTIHDIGIWDITAMYGAGKEPYWDDDLYEHLQYEPYSPTYIIEPSDVPTSHVYGGDATPSSPAEISPVEVWISTYSGYVAADDLHFADELKDDGRVYRYTKTVKVNELTWKKSTVTNVFFADIDIKPSSSTIYCTHYTQHNTPSASVASMGDYEIKTSQYNRIYIKNKDCTTIQQLLDASGEAVIYYEADTPIREQKPVTPLYTNGPTAEVVANCEATITLRIIDKM